MQMRVSVVVVVVDCVLSLRVTLMQAATTTATTSGTAAPRAKFTMPMHSTVRRRRRRHRLAPNALGPTLHTAGATLCNAAAADAAAAAAVTVAALAAAAQSCVFSLSHSLVSALIGVVAVCAVATFTFTSCSCLRRSRSCSRRCRRCTRCALHTAVLVGQVPAKLAFSRNATFASCGCPTATVQSAPRAAEQTMTTRQRRQRRRMTKGEDGSEEATLASHLQAVESGCSAETVDSSRDVGRGQCQWQRCRSLRSVAQTHSLTVHAHCDKTRNHRVKLCQVSKINSKEHFDSFL